MGRHLPRIIKLKIIELRKERFGITQIARAIENTGFKVTRQAIYFTLKKFEETGGIKHAHRSGRPPIIVEEIKQFIDNAYEENDELTSKDLQLMIRRNYNKNVSMTAIKVVRKRLGWLKSGIKYCQHVREPNRVKRLAFAKKCIITKDTFDDVIFTDESSVWLEQHARLCFRRKNCLPKYKPKVKHPYKVHVWAGISRRGRTQLLIFTGIMKQDFFVEEILHRCLLPFVLSAYPDHHRYQQDNDPKHTSLYAQIYLDKVGIYHWPTPPESPDLNPIEMLWAEMKGFLRKKVKPRNKDELVNGIKTFWKTVTIEKCNKYIDHLYKVLPVVVTRNGQASGM